MLSTKNKENTLGYIITTLLKSRGKEKKKFKNIQGEKMISNIQRNKGKDVVDFLTKPVISGRQQTAILKEPN